MMSKLESSEISFKNQLLIAMPSLHDPNFERTVIYIVEHNEEGAMGIIINQALNVNLAELFEQMEIECNDSVLGEKKVLFGGPLQHERGFILHSPKGNWNSSLDVSDNIALTTSRDILEAMVRGEAPKHILICLGYAGWDQGQLEAEIADNNWFLVPANNQLMFETPISERCQAAATSIGIRDFNSMSSDVGHA